MCRALSKTYIHTKVVRLNSISLLSRRTQQMISFPVECICFVYYLLVCVSVLDPPLPLGRLIGFAVCAGMGWLLSFIGAMTLIGGMTDKNIRTFAVLYVSGNVIGRTPFPFN